MDNKTILAWLDMQRDAVNTEITYAAPAEQKQYHEHLKIINRLAELVRLDSGEMTAVEYIETCGKICEGREICDGCALDDNCPFCMAQDPRRTVEIVKMWKEEHSDD